MSKVYATFSGFVGFEGVPTEIHDGDEYPADHPLVQANPHLFAAPPQRVTPRREAREVRESRRG